MAVEKQIWIDVIKENYYPDRSFLKRSVDMSSLVEHNTINLAEAGVDPNVLVDNKVYPVPTADRKDTPLSLPLHTFDTENTVVRNVEEMETAYDKMASVTRSHKNALYKKTATYATANWAPAKNGDLTPVVKTTGDVNGQGHKAITFEDLLGIQAKFLAMDVDPSSLVVVLNPFHLVDLQLQDMKLYKTMIQTKDLWGMDFYTFSQLPYYTVASGQKVAWGTAAAATDTQCSLIYCEDEVMRAEGDTEMFVNYKVPAERGDVIGFQQRFTALPIRGKYTSAIYSDKAGA